MDGKGIPVPPASERTPLVEVLGGVEVADPYRWLEDAASDATRAWGLRQEAYTDAVLATRPEAAFMASRLGEVLSQPSAAASPQAAGGHLFFLRRAPGEEQPALWRCDAYADMDRAALVCDPNREPEQPTAIDWYVPSPSGRFVAVGTSRDGTENSLLRVWDLADPSSPRAMEAIDHARFASIAWTPDETGLYYTRHPAPDPADPDDWFYHESIRFHVVGEDAAGDRVLLPEGRTPQESHVLRLSPDGSWLYVFSGEGLYLSAPDGWRPVDIRRIDTRRSGEPVFEPVLEGYGASFEGHLQGDGRLALKTDWKAPHYRVVEVDPAQPDDAHWRDLVPESEGLVVRGFVSVGPYVVVHALRDVDATLWIMDRTTGEGREVALPPHGSVSSLTRGLDGDCLVGFESFVKAPTLYRLDPKGGSLRVLAESPTSPLADDVEVRQVWFTSFDGTRCPMYVLRRRGESPGPRPAVLSGYGGFNRISAGRYMPEVLQWAAAGGVFALATMRGGGEYGADWHATGLGAGRQRSFDDFLAAAEYLVAEGYTSPSSLGVEGRSLGGLVMGVALTQRPELFRAAVCGVPLLDMVRSHRFLIGARWIAEYGTADDPRDLPHILAYSPYHHVSETERYPAVFLFASRDDTRVDPLHARKMTALLQTVWKDSGQGGPVLLRIYPHAGHGPGAGVSLTVRMAAETWGFLAWQCGLELAAREPASDLI